MAGARSDSAVLALFPGMGAATPGMGQPFAGCPAAWRAVDGFSSASKLDIPPPRPRRRRGRAARRQGLGACDRRDRGPPLEGYRAGGGVVSGGLGFSIGAYSALYGAGMLTVGQVVTMIDVVFEASLNLPGRYALLAVTGPPIERIGEWCRPGSVEISAVLEPGQTIVAGRESAVEQLAERIAPSALRVSPIAVRWPLHGTLMGPVAAKLEHSRELLGGLRSLRHRVYPGIDGCRITNPSKGWEFLVQQLVRPQRFDLALSAALADGFGRIVELGPGTTLARTAGRVSPGAAAVESFPLSRTGRRRGAVRRC